MLKVVYRVEMQKALENFLWWILARIPLIQLQFYSKECRNLDIPYHSEDSLDLRNTPKSP